MPDFRYFDPVFSDVNGNVTNIAQPIASNILSPEIYEPSGGLDSFLFYGAVDVNTGAAGTFTAVATTDILTKTAHGFFNGLVVQVSNSGGALPTGLSASTDYYVLVIDANTFYLCSSATNVLAASHIDITTNGSGTNTVTPTAIASASMYLQGSFDGNNWVTVPFSSTTITADATIAPLSFPSVEYKYYRFYATLASGSMAFTTLRLGYKGV